MAVTTVAAANTVDQWEKAFMSEYVRAHIFSDHMGKSENAPIQIVTKLEKEAGDQVTVSLVTRLTGTGITGDNTLEGNEEHLGNYGHQITVNQLRHAVCRGAMEQQKTYIGLLKAASMMLKLWSMDKLRSDIIAAMMSPNVDGKTAYASCSEPQKDIWLAANSDRVLFGAAKSNNAANDHSAALLQVDSTSDVFTGAIVSLMKRMLKSAANRNIRPIRVDDGGEWFVAYAGSLAFRDLKADLKSEHESAEVRGKKNPLFRDGDLQWDGVIIREVPEIPVISGVGTGAIDVAPVFFCGAQAVGGAWALKTKAIKDTRDYGNIEGVGVREIRGVEKLMFNSIQNGMGTLYVSGVADI